MEEYKFKKSTCERYDIKWGSFGWAIITIDENGGVFNAQSDFGSYSYSWPNHGRKSFKHFILELAKDYSYFLGKVADDDYFYVDKTMDNWLKQIIKDRRCQEDVNLTKEEARELWDIINEIDYSTAEGCVRELYDHRIVFDKYEEPWYYFNPCVGYSPQARAFAKEVMPMFADILKKEIEQEEKSA